MLKDYYEISDDVAKLDEAIADLDGYWKTLSMLYIKKLKLPTLNGIIITSWSKSVDLRLSNFCRDNGYNYLLLRHDKKPEKPPYPRGGYLVKISDLKKEAMKFLNLGRITIFLEPSDTFDNLYSALALFDNKEIILEVIGPGFDASDLQRGDVTPHEVIRFNTCEKHIVSRIILANDDKIYRDSVKKRYLKIAKRLRDLGMIDSLEDSTELDLAKKASRYLYENKHYYLLMNERRYRQIPDYYLNEILHYICSASDAMMKLNNFQIPLSYQWVIL